MDREDLLRKLWSVTGIERPDVRPTIRMEVIGRPEVISQVKAMIPYLRIHFPVSKHRCLVPSGWENAKKPVLNLLRQILRTLGYKVVPIPGTVGSYIVIPSTEHHQDTSPRGVGSKRSSSEFGRGGGEDGKPLRVRHDVGLTFA